MKLLVTGICGFVGSSLARLWIDADPSVEIVGIDNLSRNGSQVNRELLKKLGVRVYHGDVRSPSDFELLPACDFLIDAAANPSVLAGVDGRSSSRQAVENNLLGTVNMLEYCKAAKAGFILLSTSRVYSIAGLAGLLVTTRGGQFYPDDAAGLPAHVSAAGVAERFSTDPPTSLYGATKLASETLALEYGHGFGFPVWVNRCGVLAGAGQFGHAEQGIFSFWLHSWLAKRPLKYLGFGGTGHQTRDALHPSDLLDVIRKQVAYTQSSPPAHRVFNLSGGAKNAISLTNLSAWCRARWGEHEVASSREGRQYDIPWLVLDAGRARTFWNWEPKVGLDAILNEIGEFAENNRNWLELSST
jgi:CDP-paratose 2-epimerase